jgi:transposase
MARQAEFVICDETIERCINRLKQWRGLATRYEKRAVNYRAMVVIAAIVIWLGS